MMENSFSWVDFLYAMNEIDDIMLSHKENHTTDKLDILSREAPVLM